MKRKQNSNASARGSQRGKLVGKRVDEAKGQELGPSFADLPSAITSHILLQLPIKSLLICRCVCKTWKVVISDPHFTRLHFERSPASVLIRTNDPERVSRTLHLLEYEPLDLLDYEPKKFDDGYPSCLCEDDFLKPECKNHLKLELKFKLPLRDAKLVLNNIDGAKNPNRQRRYIACKPKDDKFDVVNSCNGILCLRGPRINDPLVVCNPITGEFIKLPEASEIDKTQIPTCDFYAGFGFQPKTNKYKKYGIGESWTKIFHLGQFVELRWPIGLHLPVKHFKIGAGILMHYSCDCFIYCESENYGFKLYKVRGTKSKFEVIPHIPSFISLKDVVKGDNVEVLNVHSRCAKFKLREEYEVLFLAEENVELSIINASSEPAEEEFF